MCVMVYKIVAIKTIRFNKTEIVSVKEILIEIILWVWIQMKENTDRFTIGLKENTDLDGEEESVI